MNFFVADSTSINLNDGIAWLELPADKLGAKNRKDLSTPETTQCLTRQRRSRNGSDTVLFLPQKVR